MFCLNIAWDQQLFRYLHKQFLQYAMCDKRFAQSMPITLDQDNERTFLQRFNHNLVENWGLILWRPGGSDFADV